MTATWDEILFTETKAGFVGRKPKFRDDEHPRDKDGRFIETGSEVRLLGGALGTVIGKGTGDRIKVRRNDTGREVEVDKGNLTVTKRPDGSAPTSKPEDAPAAMPAADPTDALVAGTQTNLDAAQAQQIAATPPAQDGPIRVGQLMAAEDVIGPERVQEITGGAGLSGANIDQARQILAEADEARANGVVPDPVPSPELRQDAPSTIGVGHVLDERSTPTLVTNLQAGQVIGVLVPGGGRRYFEVTERYNRAEGSYGRRELGVGDTAEEWVPAARTQMVSVMDNGMPEGGGAGRPTGPGAVTPDPPAPDAPAVAAASDTPAPQVTAPDPTPGAPTSAALQAIDAEIAQVRSIIERGNGGGPDSPIERRLARLLAQRDAEVARLQAGGDTDGGGLGAIPRGLVQVTTPDDTTSDTAPGGYRVGGQAEVFIYDFAEAELNGGSLMSAPQVWVAGTVESIRVNDRGLHTITVRTPDGRPHVEIVGPRGGNNRIRAIADPPPPIPDAFTDNAQLGTFLAGYLGLRADNAPRLARIFDGRVSPDFRGIAAVERRLDEAQMERWRNLQVTLGPSLRAKDGKLDGERAANALRRLEAGDPTLPILATGQHVRVRVLAEVDQPLLPNARTPLIYREVPGRVEEVRVTNGDQVTLVVVPDNPDDGALSIDGVTRSPRVVQTVPGDSRVVLDDQPAAVRPVDGPEATVAPAPDPEIAAIPAPAPRLPDTTTSLGRRRASALVGGDRINLDGDPVTVIDSVADGDDQVITYRPDDDPDAVGRLTVGGGDQFAVIEGGTTAAPPLPEETAADPVDAAESPAPITAAGLTEGDQFRHRTSLATVVEVNDTDDPDVVDVVATVQGVRTTLPMGRDGIIDRVTAVDLPVPERHGRDVDAVRPAIYSYQRRRLVSLGLDFDDDRRVAEAAQRIRARQPLSADEARLLADRLRSMTGPDSRLPYQRSLQRIADALDAAAVESGSRTAGGRFDPSAKPRRGTIADATEGDEVAFVDLAGQTVNGRVSALRTKMSGRLYEVELTGPDGTTSRHLLNKGTSMWQLGDLPDPEPVPSPAPARVQPVREHITSDRLNVGDVIEYGNANTGGITGTYEVITAQHAGDGSGDVIVDLRQTTATSLPPRNAMLSNGRDGGPSIIRIARGETSATQPWDATMADEQPEMVTGTDLVVGDRIEQLDLLGMRRAGLVTDITPMLVDDDGDATGANVAGLMVSVRHDNGTENTYVVRSDQEVSRLLRGDSDAASRIAAARVERERTEKITTVKMLLEENVSKGVSNMVARMRLNAMRNPTPAQLLEQLNQVTPPLSQQGADAGRIVSSLSRRPADPTNPNIAAVQEALQAQWFSYRQGLSDSLRSASESPIGDETASAAMNRVLVQWMSTPPALRNTGAIARGLVEGWERVATTDGGAVPTTTVRPPSLPEGADVAARVRAYRNALPEQGAFGTVPTRRVSYAKIDLDALERGEVPEVRISTAGNMDLARDGGPGQHAMAHLDVLMAAGRDLRVDLERRIADKERELGVADAPDETGASLEDLMRDYGTATLRLKQHEDRIHREVAAEFGFRAWTQVQLVLRNNLRGTDAEREQVERAIAARDADLERQRGPEREALKAAALASINAYNAKVKRVNGGTDISEAGRKRNEARRLAALELLAAVRPDGLGGHKLSYISGDSRTKGRPLKENHELVKAGRQAEQHYPTNWLRALAESRGGQAITVVSATRGGYGLKEMDLSKRPALTLSDPVGRGGVTVHELGHGMEETFPDLLAAERAWLWSRTSTGDVGNRDREPRKKLRGNNGDGYEDQFANQYTGRTYGSPGQGPNREGFEVFTTGVESLFAGSGYMDGDPSFMEFMLGSLALIGRDPEPEPPAPTIEEVRARASATPVPDAPASSATTTGGGSARRPGGRR